MKKVLVLLSIVTLTACGSESQPTDSVVDSTTVVDPIVQDTVTPTVDTVEARVMENMQ